MNEATNRNAAVAATSNARAVWSWAFFDWANSAFVVTVISAFFPLFLKRYWSVGLDPTVSTFQLGVANAIGGVLIALLAPLLGAIADQGGRKKRYLILFTAMGVVMTAALPFVARGEWQFAVALYALAVVGLFRKHILLRCVAGGRCDAGPI